MDRDKTNALVEELQSGKKAYRDQQQKFLRGGWLEGMEANMMLPDAKIDSYIEVLNFLILQPKEDADQKVLTSALALIDGRLAETAPGVYDKYKHEGFKECRTFLLEAMSSHL